MAIAAMARATPKIIASTQSPFQLLFCHGLGSAKRDLISNQIQHWSELRGIRLHKIVYSNYGNENAIWNINDWAKDILMEMRNFSKICNNKCSTESNKVDGNIIKHNRTMLVCNSAASQAVLRAFLQHTKEGDISEIIPIGMLMISPGIGMNVSSYMDRLLPGSMKALEAGQILDHPTADPSIHIKVNLSCLEDFTKNCPTRGNSALFSSITCPTRIVHGIHDRLVPCKNSVELFDRLGTKDKELYLITDGHFIKDQAIINYALDSLMKAIAIKEKIAISVLQ